MAKPMSFKNGRVRGVKANLATREISITISVPMDDESEEAAKALSHFASNPDVNQVDVHVLAKNQPFEVMLEKK